MILEAGSLVSELGELLNKTGGKIPIELTSTIQTDWTQFYTTLALTLFSSVFILFFFWNALIQPAFSAILIKIQLRSIKSKTKRNMLFIKHTSSGLFDMSMINQETMIKITQAFTKFKGKPFDLVLHTPGGEVFSSIFISRLIKEYPAQVRVIVPFFAMSGGTLLALSGSDIYMSPTACLGPVDPQIGSIFKYGSAKAWDKIVKLKGKRAEDSSISFAHTGAQYTKSIENYISSLLVGRMEDKQRQAFVKFLTSGNVEHAYPLTISSLNKFGLKVLPLDSSVAKKLNKVISSPFYEGVYSI